MAVVFTDNFTVASDTGIAAYPSGSADYAYMRGSGTNLTVNAANDRLQSPNTADEYHARIIDAAVPTTGDHEITGTVFSDTSGNSGMLLLRCSSSADSCYAAYCDLTDPAEVRIYRFVSGTATLIASADRGLTGSAARTWVFRATGSGATVSLSLVIGGTTALTFNDTNAARLTSGAPGVGIYNGTANAVYVDDISVDDLVAGGGTTVVPAAIQAAASVVNPTVALGSLVVAPSAISSVSSVVNPTVALGAVVVSPAALQALASVVNPTVVQASLVVSPTAIAIVATVLAPTVVQASLTLTPAAIAATASTPTPTVVLGALTLAPSAIQALASVVDPTVQVGGLIVTPAAVTIAASTPAPTVVQGSVALTPAALQALASTVNPTVVLASVAVSPAASTLRGSVIDPTVVVSGGAITPVAITLRASTVDPSVVLASVVVSPAALTVLASVVNPTVIIGPVTLGPALPYVPLPEPSPYRPDDGLAVPMRVVRQDLVWLPTAEPETLRPGGALPPYRPRRRTV